MQREAALTLARVTRDRLETLLEKRAATTEERDRSVAAYEAAEGHVQSGRAAVAAAASNRQAAMAANDAAAAVLSYTILTSPLDGVVTERHVDPGDMATPGVPLLTVEDISTFRLEVTLDEARAAYVAEGQQAEVAPGNNAAWTKAAVIELSRASPDSHAFVVKLDLPAGTSTRSGNFHRARFTGPAHQAVVIPVSAAIRRGQLTFVFVVDGERRARLQPIAPGAATKDTLEVLAGLAEGTRIVTNPPPGLAEGSRIDEAGR